MRPRSVRQSLQQAPVQIADVKCDDALWVHDTILHPGFLGEQA
jgi:hypothetical protein